MEHESDFAPVDHMLIDGDGLIYPFAFVAGSNMSSLDETLSYLERKVDSIVNNKLFVNSEESIHVYFTGKGGPKYRDQFFNTVEYKANRKLDKGGPAPLWIPEMMQYFMKERFPSTSAIISPEWGEADDMLAAAAYTLRKRGESYLVAGVDKDLKQIPGLHLNLKTLTRQHVSNVRALKNLYAQALIGDKSDNIPGIKGIGKVKADERLVGLSSSEEMYNAIQRIYSSKKVPHSLDEIMNLLYLRRFLTDAFAPDFQEAEHETDMVQLGAQYAP